MNPAQSGVFLLGFQFSMSLWLLPAFLPIYLAESDVGEYCAPLFKVVTITLLCSWILSQTITPLLSVYFLKVKAPKSKDHYNTKFYRRYRRFLLRLLRRPVITLIFVTLVFLIAMQGFGLIPAIFFPRDDKPIFTAEYLGDGMWSILKTCPINSEYNGAWYFFEDNVQLVKQY